MILQQFVTRVEEHVACRIALGDLEECLTGTERGDGCPGVVGRFILFLTQVRSFFRELFDSLLGQECLPLLLVVL